MFAVTTKECIHCRQTGSVMVDPEKYIEFTQTPKHLTPRIWGFHAIKIASRHSIWSGNACVGAASAPIAAI